MGKKTAATKTAPEKKRRSVEPEEEPQAKLSSVWTGTLTFGLISMNAKLHAAARTESISLNMLCPTDHSKLKQPSMFCPTCDENIQRGDSVRGYQYQKGSYVVIDPEELEAIKPTTSDVIEFSKFIKAAEIDPMLYETSYYVTPGDGGLRAYHLIRRAMVSSGMIGVAKITMSRREHLVVIRPFSDGLALHTLYYATEVPALQFPADTSPCTEKELKLGIQLLSALSGTFKHEEYADSYQVNLNKLIEAKLEGKEVPVVEKPKKAEAVTDLASALEVSIQRATKKKKAA